MHAFLLHGQDYERQKGPVTSYEFLFGLQNMVRKIPFLVINHLGNFDDLRKRRFWVVPKIPFANLCKPIYDAIIMPVSSDPLNLETVE